jgi:hypothetical protein
MPLHNSYYIYMTIITVFIILFIYFFLYDNGVFFIDKDFVLDNTNKNYIKIFIKEDVTKQVNIYIKPQKLIDIKLEIINNSKINHKIYIEDISKNNIPIKSYKKTFIVKEKNEWKINR